MGFGRRLVRKSVRRATPRSVRRAMHPAQTVRYAVTPRPVKQVSRAAYAVRHPVGAAENKAIGIALSTGTGHRRARQRTTANRAPRRRKVRNLTPRQRKTRRTLNLIALAVIAVCVIVIIAIALSGGGSSNKYYSRGFTVGSRLRLMGSCPRLVHSYSR